MIIKRITTEPLQYIGGNASNMAQHDIWVMYSSIDLNTEAQCRNKYFRFYLSKSKRPTVITSVYNVLVFIRVLLSHGHVILLELETLLV